MNHPLLWLISGTLYIVCLLVYYTILLFGEAEVKISDAWFIISQFLICGGAIFLLFFYTGSYFEITIFIAVILGLLLATEKTSGEKEFAFYGYFILSAVVAIFAFFIIPLIGFMAYFKLDEKEKRRKR